jgi:hypothetical protein
MDNRSVFLSVGLVATVISIIACSNLTQFALTTVSATNSTILSATPTSSLTGMPGSLDSAKALLAKAIMDMRSGNTQFAIAEVEAANQTMTQFQQPMQNVMNTENGSNTMHLAEAMKDIKAGDTQSALVQLGEANQTITQFQQAMLNIMNAHKSSFPPMAAGGNISQQQSTLLMNTKRPPSPLMTGGSGARNQQETQNMLSSLNNINSNDSTTAMGANNHITAKK